MGIKSKCGIKAKKNILILFIVVISAISLMRFMEAATSLIPIGQTMKLHYKCMPNNKEITLVNDFQMFLYFTPNYQSVYKRPISIH